jgi:hypothetical protein
MYFDLPITSTEHPPEFTSAAECREWLQALTLTQPVQNQALFLRQLSLLIRFTLSAAERFSILEALRSSIHKTQNLVANKFIDKPLPLSPPEQAALDSTLAVWQSLFANYLQCIEVYALEETYPKALSLTTRKNATAIQRALTMLAEAQIYLIYGKRLPDFGYWKKLHQIFLFAESNNLIHEKIKDPLRYGKHLVTPLAVYAECHLLYIVSPYEFTSRDLVWVARWTQRWGTKIKLLREPPEDISNCAHPLWVDLNSDQPADYAPQDTQEGRWLETTALRVSLTSRIALLAQGRPPNELQLGNDVTQPNVSRLLTHLLHRWCQGGSTRKHIRQRASGYCHFIVSYEAAHFHLSGQRQVQSAPKDDSSRREEREKLALFGDSSHRLDIAAATPNALPVEAWRIMEDWNLLDTSAAGLRISRPIKEGVRIAIGTLVAARTESSKNFTLGCVRWALRQDTNALAVGIQLFPGEAKAIMARIVTVDHLPHRPAFFIEANESTESPASLVLPVGSFQIGRRIEIMRTSAEVVTLTHLVAHGSEFECATFTTEA